MGKRLDNRPIGIFDSGIGGLTILNDLTMQFKNESFVYIADTKNNPYGVKTEDEIKKIVDKMVNELIKLNVKAIVIACNTASAYSSHLNIDIPVINMIENTVKETYKNHVKGKVLVLSTKLTQKSRLYSKYLASYNIKPFEVEASNFVDLIEQLMLNDEKIELLVYEKLGKYRNKNIKTVVLGCTHFGYIKSNISKVLGDVRFISGAKEIANKLKEKKVIFDNTNKQIISLYTTGDLNLFIDKVKSLNIKFDQIERIV